VAREQALVAAGYTVLRFWKNEAARNLDDVIADIKQVLEDRPATPPSV
jgi:very-short-patch-repair endonuclease